MRFDELKRIEEITFLPDERPMEETRDLFLFCYYTALRFSDAVRLSPLHLSEGAISLATQKNRKRIKIPLLEEAQAILDKYKGVYPGRLLPKMSNSEANRHLKHICLRAGLTEKVRITERRGRKEQVKEYEKWQLVGTHCARRTIISYALGAGVPMKTVEAITGNQGYGALMAYINISKRDLDRQMQKAGVAWRKDTALAGKSIKGGK